MLPALAMNNLAYDNFRNAEFSGYKSLLYSRGCQLSNFEHISFVKNSRPNCASARMSSFISHIFVVVDDCSKEEMVGADTVGNIAFMANAHSFGNRAVSKLIGKSMGEVFSSWIPNGQLTMTLWHHASSPEPAATGFDHLSPEKAFVGFSGINACGHGETYTKCP